MVASSLRALHPSLSLYQPLTILHRNRRYLTSRFNCSFVEKYLTRNLEFRGKSTLNFRSHTAV